MLATTATFDKYRVRPNAKAKFLLTIEAENPTRTFYFTDERIVLSTSGESFDALIMNWGRVRQTIDLFTKKSNVGNVKVTLMNVPYKRDSSGAVCLSDELSAYDIVNRRARIYCWFEGITSLADCLKIFEGLVQPLREVTPETLDVELMDSTFKRHMVVPRNTFKRSNFPDVTSEVEVKSLPLHYGTFVPTKDDGNPTKGAVAEGFFVAPDKVLVADHVMKAVNAVYIFDEGIGELVLVDSAEYTVILDDSGRTTVTFNNLIDPLLTAYIYPDKADITHLDDPHYVIPDNKKGLSYDRDNSTFTEISVASYAQNGNQDDNHIDHMYARFKTGNPVGDYVSVYLQANHVGNFSPGYLVNARVRFWIDATSTDVGDMVIEGVGSGPNTYDQSDITTLFGTNGLTLQDVIHPNGIHVYLNALYRVGAGRRKLIELYDVRLKITYRRSIERTMRVFVEGEGRKFGSWVDAGGRSNSYNAGDLIKNPAFIIESILRDEIGLTDSQIAVASFDGAGGNLTTWDMVLSIMEPINTESLIEEISRQSKLNFFFSSDDLAKLAIIDNSPTIEDDQLLSQDCVHRSFEIQQGDARDLVNKLRLNYSPWPVDRQLKTLLLAENTTSQADYDIIREIIFNAPGIASATVAGYLKDHLVGSSGFWKDLRSELSADMAFWEHINWEVGDLIEPTSSFDSILKHFGTGWGTQLFMIVEKILSMRGLSFTMLKVN